MTDVAPVVTPTTELGTFVPAFLPLENVSPFTLRDGYSYLEVLSRLRMYINNDLVPFVNDQVNILGSGFTTEVNKVIDNINLALATQEANINQALTTQQDTVTADITDLTDYVNTQVQSIINSSVNVQDPVVAGIFQNLASATRLALDAAYISPDELATAVAPVAGLTTDVTNLKTLTNTGRLSAATLGSAFNARMELDATPYLVADGATGDSDNLATAIAAAVAAKMALRLPFGKTIALDKSIIVPSGAIIRGNGVTFKKLVSLAGIAFNISGKTGVVLEDFTIDGQKTLFPTNEFQHGIYVINGSTNVRIRNVNSNNNNGDGVYIGDQANASSNVTLDNVWCSGNNRNGMSISHVSGFRATNSGFVNTIGTNPQAGVDIEPNVDNIVCEDIVFIGCTFSGNFNSGIKVSLRNAPTVRQGNINFIGCVVRTNGVGSSSGSGVELVASRDVTFQGGNISDNVGPGVLADPASTPGACYRTRLIGVTIRNNRNQGVYVTSSFDGFDLIDNHVLDNGYGNPGNYPGVFFNPGTNPLATSVNAKVIGNRFDNAQASYNLRCSAVVAGAVYLGNEYLAVTTAARLLQDTATSRLDIDRGQTATVSGAKGSNAALASLITALVAKGIITDTTTA